MHERQDSNRGKIDVRESNEKNVVTPECKTVDVKSYVDNNVPKHYLLFTTKFDSKSLLHRKLHTPFEYWVHIYESHNCSLQFSLLWILRYNFFFHWYKCLYVFIILLLFVEVDLLWFFIMLHLTGDSSFSTVWYSLRM